MSERSEITVRVHSELLGELTVHPEQVIVLTQGLAGFPEGRDFALLPTGREGVYWLQSLDFTALSFLLIDPFLFFPGRFEIDLEAEDLARIGTSDASAILVLAIVTLGGRMDQPATANLRAPILFNLAARTAHQSIRKAEVFGVREPIETSAIVGEAG